MPNRLSCLLYALYLGRCASLSSSSPLDLAAFPKYNIVLTREILSNASALALLASQTDQEEDYELMRTRNGQAFVCSIPRPKPPVPSPPLEQEDQDQKQLSHAERRQARRLEAKSGLEKGLQLLEPLKSGCLYQRHGWFTYTFCHGSEIRQFHEIRQPGTNAPAEDPNTEAYTLGVYPNPENTKHDVQQLPSAGAMASQADSHGGLSEILVENSLSLSGLSSEGDDAEQNFDDENGRRYLVQRWNGGTVCDMTGLPRRVEVQFHCNTQSTDRIALIREVGICDYVMAVHTPRLCGESIFLASSAGHGSEADRKVLDISCRRVAGKDGQVPAATIDEEAQPYTERTVPAVQAQQETPSADEAQAGGDANPFQAEESGSHAMQPEPESEGEDDWFAVDSDAGDANAESETLVVVFDPATGDIISKTPLDKFDDKAGLFRKLAAKQDEDKDPPLAIDKMASYLEIALNKILDESAEAGEIDEASARALREKFNIKDPAISQKEKIKDMQEQARQLASSMARLKDVMHLFGAQLKSGHAQELDISDVLDKVLKDGKGRQQVTDQQRSRQYPGGETHEKLKDLYSGQFDDSQDEEEGSNEKSIKRDEL